MDFRTEIKPEPVPFRISHSSVGFMAGSCFAENIYLKMSAAKFNVAANPTGILFNPASIAGMITSLADGRKFTHSDLRSDGDVWFGWQHHGSFSDVYAEVALDNMNEAARMGAAALAGADYAVITFGTAWIYRLAETGEVVANCHKQPSGLFVRERLTAGEITGMYGALLEGPLAGKNVIFTVSPVRHLKDGLEENSFSKAILRTAVGELVGKYDNAHYFPSFEIMNDDLRDYRFYAEDMVHPSGTAVDYIWKKFADWVFDGHSRELLPRLEKLSSAMKHRVMNPGSDANLRFRDVMLAHIEELQKELPAADFSDELAYFSAI